MNFIKICLLFFIVACTYAFDDLNRKMVCLVNKERAKRGLPYLAISSTLVNAAQKHSNYQYNKKTMTHEENVSGYRKAMDRVLKAGFKNPSYVGENVAHGQETIENVIKSWMNSSGHRSNILDKNFTYIGIARKGNYWTQDFAASRNGKPKNVKKCP